eukprot:3152893-Prymnesium_polylepis.1
MSSTCLPQIAQMPLAYAHIVHHCAPCTMQRSLQILQWLPYGLDLTPFLSSVLDAWREDAGPPDVPPLNVSGVTRLESRVLQSSQTMWVGEQVHAALGVAWGPRRHIDGKSKSP